MSRRFWFAFTLVFAAAFLLLGVGQCGYRKLNLLKSLDAIAADIQRNYPRIEHISTATLAALLESPNAPGILLIDARKPAEFAVSHLPGAVNLQTPGDVRRHLAAHADTPEASGTPPIVVYCSVGYRSAVLADKLRRAGIAANVRNVTGSIFQLANEDRPLVKPGGQPAATVHPYNKTWGRLVDPGKRAPLDRKP